MIEVEVVTLDVREDIRAGREPFGKIMKAVRELKRGQGLEIVNTFEPVPLYSALGQLGFSHSLADSPEGLVRVLFYKPEEARVVS